jgi:hypothetical protein
MLPPVEEGIQSIPVGAGMTIAKSDHFEGKRVGAAFYGGQHELEDACEVAVIDDLATDVRPVPGDTCRECSRLFVDAGLKCGQERVGRESLEESGRSAS